MKQSATVSARGRSKSAGNSISSRNGNANSSRNSNSDSARNGNSTSSRDSRGPNTASNKADSRSNSSSADHGNATAADKRRVGSGGQGQFHGQSHLEKFFLNLLQDIYYAEQKIVQSLPKMQDAATTSELKEAFEDHLHQTQRHVKRLEKVFGTLGKKAEGKKCEAIEGIVREVETIIGETEEGTLTRDAALIIAAQKVEHYEIATYGGLVQLAITMQLHDAADLLDKTLVEEEDTDARLTEIAENEINLGAEHEGNQYSWDAPGKNSGEQEEEEDVDEGPSV